MLEPVAVKDTEFRSTYSSLAAPQLEMSCCRGKRQRPLHPDELVVASDDPDARLDAIERLTDGHTVRLLLVTPADFQRLWSHLAITLRGDMLAQAHLAEVAHVLVGEVPDALLHQPLPHRRPWRPLRPQLREEPSALKGQPP